MYDTKVLRGLTLIIISVLLTLVTLLSLNNYSLDKKVNGQKKIVNYYKVKEAITSRRMNLLERNYNTMKIALEAPSDDFFYYKEFDSRGTPGSGRGMDSVLLKKLTLMQTKLGYNLKVNSGYRTHTHNSKVGGVSNSAHKTKDAVDLRVLNNRARYDIVREAILLGFTRIGIHKRFIHLDVDTTKQENIIWMY